MVGKYQKVSLSLFAFAVSLSINAFALQHSQPAFGDSSTFNVFIKAEGVHKGESYVGQCNGSLIAPDLVVTAGHCMAGSLKMLEGSKISVGNYIRKVYPNGNSTNYYYKDLDVIGVKNVYFPKSIDAKVRTGTMTGTAAISASEDVALIELERPVDMSKVPVQFISFATPTDYQMVKINPKSFQFIVVSTNVVMDNTMETKRYAPENGMSLDGMLNQVYRVPMWNSDMYYQVEEGDSGAPLLVNVAGKWKLFGIVKGTKRDSLSGYIEKWTGKEINITPELNLFTPIAYQMCGLLKQANRSCLQ